MIEAYPFNSLLFSWGDIDGMGHILVRLIKYIPEKNRLYHIVTLTIRVDK